MSPFPGNNRKTLLTLSLLAGLLSGVAIHYLSWWLGWICYVPIFYLLIKYRVNVRTGMLAGAITGIAQALIIQAWVFPTVAAYTGHFIFPGTFIWLFLVFFNAVKFLVIFGLTAKLLAGIEERSSRKWVTAPLAASLFVAVEALIGSGLKGFPWVYTFLGYTQTTNIYFLQLAEWGGVGVISWFVVLVNFMLASYLVAQKRSSLIYALMLLALIQVYGGFRIGTLDRPAANTLKMALICDHSPPDMRWNESELNRYVQQLFALNHQALDLEPDIVVWNESVIPWTYRKDDDFLLYLLEQGRGSGTSHLISYYSESVPGNDYPAVSAYLVYPDGSLAGKYDKSELLSGVEKPLLSFFNTGIIQLPFALDHTLADHAANPSPEPIQSQYGSIGVMMCNESSRDEVAGKLAGQDISFMVLMSNNAWFNASTPARLHFNYTRMRAVENRTAIVINSNLGISGLVDHTGRILLQSESKEPQVLLAEVPQTGASNNYLQKRNLFHALVVVFLLAGLIVPVLRQQKHNAYEGTGKILK